MPYSDDMTNRELHAAIQPLFAKPVEVRVIESWDGAETWWHVEIITTARDGRRKGQVRVTGHFCQSRDEAIVDMLGQAATIADVYHCAA